MFNEKNITKFIVIIPFFFILITVISASYISITLLNSHFEKDIITSEKQELQLQKQYIKNQIDSIYNYIEYKKIETKRRLKERLKNRVYRVHELASKIYNEKKDLLSKEDLKQDILEVIKKIRFGKNGYYFLVHMKSDKELIPQIQPAKPNAENINAYDFKDVDGKYYVQEFANVVNNSNEGFVEYKWFKLTKAEQYKKLSFVKVFEPYNWFIGYGEYLDDFEKNIKNEAKKRLDLFKYGKNGYVWTHDTNHILLQHPYRREFIGKSDIALVDKKNTKIIQMFVKKALANENGSFVEYYWNKPNEVELTKKIAYVKHIKDWNWVIGTGVYNDDINLVVSLLRKQKEEDIFTVTSKSIIFSVIILVLVSIFSILISRRVSKSFINYKKEIHEQNRKLENINSTLEEKVEEKTTELKNLNEQLEEKISKRVEELKERDNTLAQQSKMVALGEMIGNIAHQWRQPLSTISTAASGLKLKKEMDILTDEDIIQFSDGIVKNSKYLSQVIEDFKDYVKDEKVKTKFNICESTSNALNIFDSSIHNHNLKIVEDFKENVFINNYKNELVQALVNILNNAKDALKEQQEDENDRLIFITTDIIENKATIIIKDSAGGVSDNIISKIFEPYFTTKNKKQGTGLGLYMSYQIIVDSMNGELKVENSLFTYKNKSYKGAKFIISFDLTK